MPRTGGRARSGVSGGHTGTYVPDRKRSGTRGVAAALDPARSRMRSAGRYMTRITIDVLVKDTEPQRMRDVAYLLQQSVGVISVDVGDHVAQTLLGLEVLPRDVGAVGGQGLVDARQDAGHVLVQVDEAVGASLGR